MTTAASQILEQVRQLSEVERWDVMEALENEFSAMPAHGAIEQELLNRVQGPFQEIGDSFFEDIKREGRDRAIRVNGR